MIINEKNCIEAWKRSLRYIIDNGSENIDADHRNSREIINLHVNIENPHEDYDKILDVLKKFDWIYPTPEELSNIVFNREDSAMYEYSYGPRLFNFFGKKDQINDYIIPILKNNPSSRRAVISLYNPSTDSDVYNNNLLSMMFMQFRIMNGKLRCTCFIRSNDFFIGWPGNIYQIYLLQKYVAEKLRLKPGMLSTISCSAHVFDEHIEQINTIL